MKWRFWPIIEWRRGESNPRPENHKSLPDKEVSEKPKNATAQKLPKNSNSGMESIQENDTELQQIISAWLDLPEYIKQAIKALIQTHIVE